MRQILADEALQSAFLSQGYVKVPFLPSSDVAYLVEQVATLRPDDGFVPDGSYTTYHCSFLDTNLEYKRQTYALIRQVFEPHIADLLVDFHLLNANFYVKPPGTGEFSIHQNWPAIADLRDTTVTIWCPLADVIESNGAIQVVAGSHKIVPHIEAPKSPAYFADFGDELIRDYLKPVEMQAGEAIIFDDSLIHWSARNDSEQPRVAIQVLCVPVDAMPVFFCKVDDTRFELIHADCEFFLEHGPQDLQSRQPHWKSLGYIDNPNRPISEREFARLLADGDKTRAAIYGVPGASPRKRRNWFDRLRSQLG